MLLNSLVCNDKKCLQFLLYSLKFKTTAGGKGRYLSQREKATAQAPGLNVPFWKYEPIQCCLQLGRIISLSKTNSSFINEMIQDTTDISFIEGTKYIK